MKTKNKSVGILSLMGVFAIATILSSATLLSSPSAYAADQTCTWIGSAEDNKFSTAANWKECAGGVPTAGDIIRFDRFPTINSNQQLTNDLGVALGGLVVQQQAEQLSNNEKNYYVNINTLTFVNNAIIKKDKISIDKSDGFVKVRADKIIGQGNLIVAGGVGEYYGKTVFEVKGDLIAKSQQFYPSVNSKAYKLVLSATESEYDVFYKWSVIKDVNYDSLVIQRKVVFTIDVTDVEIKKPIYIERGDLSDGPDPCIGISTGTTTISGPIYLNSSNLEVWASPTAVLNITGRVEGVNYAIDPQTWSGQFGVLNYKPTYDNSETGDISHNSAGGIMNLKGELAGNSETIQDKFVAILENATRRDITVLKGGQLRGSGVVREYLTITRGATLVPGNSPGCISAGFLTLGGELQIELGGKGACSEYDQIKVTGIDSDLRNEHIVLEDGATLSVSGYGAFSPQKGDTFVIIDNQTDKPVKGTFKDLPEGAEVKIGEATFTISYVGGDGNDVVLTATNGAKLPGVPRTGITQMSTTNPAVVMLAGLASVVVLVFGARKFSLFNKR